MELQNIKFKEKKKKKKHRPGRDSRPQRYSLVVEAYLSSLNREDKDSDRYILSDSCYPLLPAQTRGFKLETFDFDIMIELQVSFSKTN